MQAEDLDQIIEMGWEDRKPFEASTPQFGLSEAEVVALMGRELNRRSFELWRQRVYSDVSRCAAASAERLSSWTTGVKRYS